MLSHSRNSSGRDINGVGGLIYSDFDDVRTSNRGGLRKPRVNESRRQRDSRDIAFKLRIVVRRYNCFFHGIIIFFHSLKHATRLFFNPFYTLIAQSLLIV